MAQRRRVARGLVVCVLLISLALVPFTALAQGEPALTTQITQVDVSHFPQVTVYVSVTDAAGEPAAIDPARILLYENGERVVPDEVHGMGEGEPLYTLLVIDVSGSMNTAGKLDAAKAAARAYLAQMRPQDRAGVIAFNTEVMVAQSLTADRTALLSAVDSLQAAHDTALYDAVAQAISILESVDGRKAILILSDGMDNRSRLSLQQALAGIGPGGLSISTIGLGDRSRPGDEWVGIDESALRAMADQAGGSYSFADDADALRQLYERLGRTLQSEYAIRYTSPSTLRDGVSRSLTVTLSDVPVPAQAATRYNPGGLVPEVAQPAPWPIFAAVLAGLLALLLVPRWVAVGWHALRRRAVPGAPSKARPGVRLHDPPKPKIRLR
ncbi:MAG: VWA domain-containing protein [Chloroflexota bacterium]